MSTEKQSRTGRATESTSEDRPELAVCESAPGKAVFIECENSDGWIAIDGAVEVTQ